jgi:hypothetical protein
VGRSSPKARWPVAVVATVACVLASADARADGIDIAWFVTRVGGWKVAPGRAALLVLMLAAINYAINAVVIGIPAYRAGVSGSKICRELVGLTVLGQIADRLGLVASAAAVAVIGVAVESLFHTTVRGVRDLGTFALVTVALNFLTSGVLIGLLVRHYVCRRWSQPRRKGLAIALAAAVLTNPAWAVATSMSPWFGPPATRHAEVLHSSRTPKLFRTMSMRLLNLPRTPPSQRPKR